jgi:hypothetical protein
MSRIEDDGLAPKAELGGVVEGGDGRTVVVSGARPELPQPETMPMTRAVIRAHDRAAGVKEFVDGGVPIRPRSCRSTSSVFMLSLPSGDDGRASRLH